jgi:hypothetical protein
MRFISIIAFISMGLSVVPGCASEAPAAYGAKVRYSSEKTIRFPDFELRFTGERRVTTPQFPRGFVYHDFTASTKSERVKVSWSSGTGDIGPAGFTIAGKKFRLELSRSDTAGRLKTDELVVSRDRAGN